VLGIYELGAIHPSDQPLRLGVRELTGSEIMSWFGVFFLTLYIPAVFGIAGSKSKRRESLAAISKDALALPAMPGRTLLGRSSAASA
jgi:hypothetical protein